MLDGIPVSVISDPSWDAGFVSAGDEYLGTLVEISGQSDDSGKIAPVGIVILRDDDAPDRDGTFQSVPVEFIRKMAYL